MENGKQTETLFHFIFGYVWALCLSITIQIKSVLTPSKFTIETLLLIAFEIKIYLQSSALRSFIFYSKNSIQLYFYIWNIVCFGFLFFIVSQVDPKPNVVWFTVCISRREKKNVVLSQNCASLPAK